MGPFNATWTQAPASAPRRRLMRVDVKLAGGKLGTFYGHYASSFDALESAMDRMTELDRVQVRPVESEQAGALLPHCFAGGQVVAAND